LTFLKDSVLKKLIGALLLSLTCLTASAASLVHENPMARLTVTIHDDKPCTVKNIPEDAKKQLKLLGAEVVYHGQKLNACWTIGGVDPSGQPVIFVIDEEGDNGFLLANEFKPVK
jgi:hypothetical protein